MTRSQAQLSFRAPQGHRAVPPLAHGSVAQSPAWQLFEHRWPQLRCRMQRAPHEKAAVSGSAPAVPSGAAASPAPARTRARSSSQESAVEAAPQWQRRRMTALQGGHDPEWQAAARPQACVQRSGRSSSQGRVHASAQGPPWQALSQRCLPQGSRRPHGEAQAKSAGAEHGTSISPWPPTHCRRTGSVHGGHFGAGAEAAPDTAAAARGEWHGAAQAWPQRARTRPHGRSQGGQSPAWHGCGDRAACRQSGAARQRSEHIGGRTSRSRPHGTSSVVPPQAQATDRVRGHGPHSLWQRAPHEQLPQASARPQTSMQVWQSPAQHLRLHACRSQFRGSVQRRSHRSWPSRQRPRRPLERPQRQGPSVTASHSPQAPSWQRRAQLCAPQAIARPQVSPQLGAGSSQARPGYARFPQGHARPPAALAAAGAQGSHSPLWHSRAHACRPQSSALPQTAPQEKSRRKQGSVRAALPQRHRAPTTGKMQGPQAPWWHWAPHGCAQPAAAAPPRAAPVRPQGSPHVEALCPQRFTGAALPHQQGVVTGTAHGAQGPRWQRCTQACAQSARGRAHGASQLCGASSSRSSKAGSRVLPQKQR